MSFDTPLYLCGPLREPKQMLADQQYSGHTSIHDDSMAEKLGFDAYGVSRDMPDPVARAIGQMLDHMHAVDSRLEGMCKALSELGSDYCAKELPTLGGEDFELLKDESQPSVEVDAASDSKA